jgi:hypothetical protein
VRPKTPNYRLYNDVQRNDKIDELENQDKRQRAIILLQRLLRGRAK